METKFTKGNWEVKRNEIVDFKGDVLFKSIWQLNNQFFYRTENEQNANAKLIASAPEMFEMLEECLSIFKKYKMKGSTLIEIEKILTKITE